MSSTPRPLFHAVAYNEGMLKTADLAKLAKAYGGQTGLALAVGVAQPTVSRWLKGAMPDPRAAMAASIFLCGDVFS